VTSSACHVISKPARSYFPLSLIETSPLFPFPIIKNLSTMLFSSSSSTIQCKREYIREDNRYMRRERTHTRIAMNEKENMTATTFIFSEISTSGHI